jgi:hypothetical protein
VNRLAPAKDWLGGKLIEVELAGLAAERATPENLQQIAEELVRMTKSKRIPKEFVLADVDFHLAIGRAASNCILMNALHLIRNLLQQWILSAVAVEGVPPESARSASPYLARHQEPRQCRRSQANAETSAGNGSVCSAKREIPGRPKTGSQWRRVLGVPLR